MQFRKKLLFIGVINLLALPLAFKNFNSDINIKYNFVTKKELESNVKDRAFTFNVVKNTEKKFINKDNSMQYTNLKWKNLMTKKSQQICVNTPQNSIIF